MNNKYGSQENTINSLRQTLERIVERMNGSEDEESHYSADCILIELIEKLALNASPEDQEETAAILKAYNKLNKWYA